MCFRCMTIGRVCSERRSRLKVHGYMQSEVNYLFSRNAVGIGRARLIYL